jgi:hypothetical protein
MTRIGELAAAIGVTRQSVSAWAREGCPVYAGTAAVIEWRARNKPTAVRDCRRECSCMFCNKTFLAYYDKRYCSAECRSHAASSQMATFSCDGCGKEVRRRVPKNGWSRYCSRACWRLNCEARRGECRHCHTPLAPCSDGWFCSKKCKTTATWINKQLSQLLRHDKPTFTWKDRCERQVGRFKDRAYKAPKSVESRKECANWTEACIAAVDRLRVRAGRSKWKEKCSRAVKSLRHRPLRN